MDVIFDLECTCAEPTNPEPMEITEIGAVILDETGKELDRFTTFVKPRIYPTLSEFCTRLTTITQEDVDNAPDFCIAINRFRDWIAKWVGDEEYRLWSWGDFDRTMVKSESNLHGISSDWIDSVHYNLKRAFAIHEKMERQVGMARALRQKV